MMTPKTIYQLLYTGHTIMSPSKTVLIEPGGSRPARAMFIKREERGEYVTKRTLKMTPENAVVAMELMEAYENG